MKRKILAQFLALGLALTSLPASAYAAEAPEDVTVETESAETSGENAEVAEDVSEDDNNDSSSAEKDDDATEAEGSNKATSLTANTAGEEDNSSEEDLDEDDAEEDEVDADELDDESLKDEEETASINASKVTIKDDTYYYVIKTDDVDSDVSVVLDEEENITTDFSDFVEIDDTDVYFYTTDSVSGIIYGTAKASYSQLYSGQTSTADYDAVSSATTRKSTLFTSTDVSEVTEDGYYIYGIKNANIGISKNDYVKASILDKAGKQLPDKYSNLLEITLNESSDVPAYYLPYDGNNFKQAVINKKTTIDDATGAISYNTRYGKYMLQVQEVSTNYLRKTRDNDIYPINNSVHGAILRGTDANGNSISLGVRHLKELWVSPYEIAFNPDTNNAVSFEGGYITSVDYLTESDVFTYNLVEPVKIKKSFDASALKAFFNKNNAKALIVSGFENALNNATLSLSYREGRTSVAVVENEAVNVENGRIKYVVESELVPETSYTINIVNDDYADIQLTVTPETIDEDTADTSEPAEPGTDEPAQPENPGTDDPAQPENPSTDEPTQPENPGTDEPTQPENPGTDEPTQPETPATEEPEVDVPAESPLDWATPEQKECVKKLDAQIRCIVDNVIVPTIQKCCPGAKDVLPTVVKQLQIIQQNVLKFLFGRW